MVKHYDSSNNDQQRKLFIRDEWDTKRTWDSEVLNRDEAGEEEQDLNEQVTETKSQVRYETRGGRTHELTHLAPPIT